MAEPSPEGIQRLWRDFEIVAGFIIVLVAGGFWFLWLYASSRIKSLWLRLNGSTDEANKLAVWNVRMYATKDDVLTLIKKIDGFEERIHSMLREQRQDIAEMIKLRSPVKSEDQRNDRQRNHDIEIDKN